MPDVIAQELAPTTVCAVVVNYNTSSSLGPCLESLFRSGVSDVVLVDNSSDRNGEWERVQELASKHGRVTTHRNGENRGFAAGVNRGLLLVPSTATHVILMNPDARLHPAALKRMIGTLSAAGDLAMVSPRVLFPDGTPWYDGGSLDLAAGTTFQTAKNAAEDEVIDQSFIPGAVLLAPIATLGIVGPLREDLFMYWEDTDLCRRASAAGVRLLLDRGCVAIHEVGSSSRATNGERKSALWHYYMNRNRIIVCGESGVSVFGLIFGPGRRVTAKLLVTAGRDAQPLLKLRAALRGIRDGVRTVRRVESRGRRPDIGWG